MTVVSNMSFDDGPTNIAQRILQVLVDLAKNGQCRVFNSPSFKTQRLGEIKATFTTE